MSFASEVKEELCRTQMTKKCCVRAELYGILLFCQSFRAEEIKIVTALPSFAKRLPELLYRGFKLEFDRLPSENEAGKRAFLLQNFAKIAALREVFGYDSAATPAHHINFAAVEEEHCRTAFLRGAFLAGGSVSDPMNSYHLELVTTHFNVSRELTALLHEAGFAPKQTLRKSSYVTYFKPSESIEDFLTAIGAPLSAMNVMTAKLERHLRGSINRAVNCDTANLDKTVDAAMGQVEAIGRLEAQHQMESLPEKLLETARLRLLHTDLNLAQLALLHEPPVTKSCLNHRLRKLMELSKNG